ncbi:cytochrome c [Planctomycetota bacterium]|nr:cytochrome c [Planctomycetota bacterium]
MQNLLKWAPTVAACGALLALVPFAVIAKARSSKTTKPRIHVIHDMDNQERFKAQQANPMFADGRSMRPPLPGTVARGELKEDDHFYRGIVANAWAAEYPEDVRPLTAEFLARGQERYEIHCAPCHGLSGYGDGPVAVRAALLAKDGATGTIWATPTTYHDDSLRAKEHGYLFHVISHGVRNMPGYGAQIEERDRWAIVAYLRALQRSQNPGS